MAVIYECTRMGNAAREVCGKKCVSDRDVGNGRVRGARRKVLVEEERTCELSGYGGQGGKLSAATPR